MTEHLPATAVKTCTRCGDTKTLGAFYRGASWCKPCCRADQNERNRKLRSTIGVEAVRARARERQALYRSDPQRRARERLGVKARGRALEKLAGVYPEAFAALLRVERAELGLKPDPGPDR